MKAIAAASVFLMAAPVYGHSTQTRWPHEGRIVYDGGTLVQVDFLYHKFPGVFTSSDGFLELDLHMPKTFYGNCTVWSNMPRFYSDCGTGGEGLFTSEGTYTGSDPNYYAFGAGSYAPTTMAGSTWYQARYTLYNQKGSSTGGLPVNFGWQEVERWQCISADPWCLAPVAGSRIHKGVAMTASRYAASSWLTPEGATKPIDYLCDKWATTCAAQPQ